MNARTWGAIAAATLAISGCSKLADLLGDDEADVAPTASDPSLVPVQPVEPEPVAPPPEPTPVPEAQPAPGGFTLPGLEGLPIPLPIPQGEARDPAPPARGSLGAAPAGSWDANGHMTRAFLEQETREIHRALLAALDPAQRAQVENIPFEIVDERSEPNAAAACLRSQHARMMITSAMIELAAGISEAKAYDELADTQTYETYVTSVVDQVRREQPVTGVDPSLHTAPHATDAHKLARQRHLFDQQIAFILGHELGHHHLGHTNCVGGRTQAQIERDEMAAVLSHTVPPFEQPREIEADMWGLTNVLEAGHERPGGTWSHEGALLNMDFFRRLSDHGGAELVLAFLSTHPPSIIRIPIIRSTAQQWTPGWRPPRMPTPGDAPAGDGDAVEIPTPGGPIRLPGNLPIDPRQLPIDPRALPIPLPQPR